MTDTPRFCVTIPAYNAEITLAGTVASVQAQTFADWELVIVDDGSTDGTGPLAERLASGDPRIRVVHQENRGSGGAYNTAVRTAASSLLVTLSADDLLLPGHLEAFDSFIAENPDAAVFTCDGFYEYADGEREVVGPNRAWADPAEATLEDLFRACFFGVGAVYRREVFDTIGGYHEDMYAEDYLFWLSALANGFRHRYLDRLLAVHRRGSVQKSADALRVREAEVTAIRTVLEVGHLNSGQRVAGEHALSRLKAVIRMRRFLAGLLGSRRASGLIDVMRGRHRRTPSLHDG